MTLGALGRGVGLDPTPVQNCLMWPNLPHLKQVTLGERRRPLSQEFPMPKLLVPCGDGTICHPCVSHFDSSFAARSRDSCITWTVLETTHNRSRSAKQRGQSANTKRDLSWGVTPSRITWIISLSGNPNLKIWAASVYSCLLYTSRCV